MFNHVHAKSSFAVRASTISRIWILSLPRIRFVVITGLSGSGKSSLAFDTIFGEGQRRYVESLSTYARQFLQLMEKPDVDSIEGLSPAISIEQKTITRNPRSTVATVTEIQDYLRFFYARLGVSGLSKMWNSEFSRKQPIKLSNKSRRFGAASESSCSLRSYVNAKANTGRSSRIFEKRIYAGAHRWRDRHAGFPIQSLNGTNSTRSRLSLTVSPWTAQSEPDRIRRSAKRALKLGNGDLDCS